MDFASLSISHVKMLHLPLTVSILSFLTKKGSELIGITGSYHQDDSEEEKQEAKWEMNLQDNLMGREVVDSQAVIEMKEMGKF